MSKLFSPFVSSSAAWAYVDLRASVQKMPSVTPKGTKSC